MIQNFRIPSFARFAKLLPLSVSAAVITVACSAPATSQIVNSDAFNESPDHSILEVADDADDSSARVQDSFSNPNPNATLRSETSESFSNSSRLTTTPPTNVSSLNSEYDAPTAPQPRLKGATPLSGYHSQPGGNTSGTFASQNEHSSPARSSHSQRRPQTNQGVNKLRSSGLRPAPEDQESPFPSSTGSFSSSPAAASPAFQSSSRSTTVVSDVAGSNSTAKIDVSSEDFSDMPKPKYESAYLHDQAPKRSSSAPGSFSSPSGVRKLTPPKQLSSASLVDDTSEANTIEQTAYLSPAAPAKPQSFQSNQSNQYNRQQNQPGQYRQQSQRGQQPQGGQRGRRGQQQGQQTTQRTLPGQTQNQNSNQNVTQASDSTSAKSTIAKFAFDANQQSANGLPIRLMDLMRQAEGRASRSQLIPQYWETYYDWAQSISATNHRDWIASIKAAKQTDGTSLEIAKSNAENAIQFSAIQLGKSQAKLKSLTGATQPIIPMDSPTVTRVKTNYAAFKNRGMISPKFEGIDATLKQMHQLITSRANTVVMAEKNTNEVKQQYSRNQATIDHLLNAARTRRAAESDFISSVIEYNKAYADYALALPYGSGPVETVVNMLIVKPANNSATAGGSMVNGRPNLSNEASSNNNTGNDYSVPYGNSSNSNPSTNRTANSNNRGGARQNNIRPASNTTSRQPAANSLGGQNSAANNLMQNTRQQTAGVNSTAQVSQPNQANAGRPGRGQASPAANKIKRPSQFPPSQPNQAANQMTAPTNSQNSPLRPSTNGFNRPRPNAQPPAGDKTAGGSNPFSAVRAADSSTGVPAANPKPPTSGFSFGG